MMGITHRMYLFVVLAFAIMAVFLWPSAGKAQGNVDKERVRAGEVIDHNMMINGEDVLISGTVNGDVIAFGRTITVNGHIDGSLVAIGETVVINGKISNNVVLASIGTELRSPAVIGRDLYFVGVRLTMPTGAAVQRDLNCLALEAQLAGEIGRDLKATIGPVQIVRIIMGPIQNLIQIIRPAQLEGNLEMKGFVRAATMSGVSAPTLGAAYNRLAVQQAAINTEQLAAWGLSTLRNFVALLFIGLFGVWLFPSPFYWTGEKIQQSPWVTMLKGFSVIVTGWFVFGLAIIIVAIVSVFFFTISMPNLAFLVGTIGLLGTSLGASVFWLSIAYISKLIVAFLIGRLLLQRFFTRQAGSKLLPMLLGVILYALAASIPFLGWAVSAIVTVFGMGALWAAAYTLVPSEKAGEVESLPAIALAG